MLLRGQLTAINADIKKQEKSQINNLPLQLKHYKKDKSKAKEGIKNNKN